MVDTSHSPALGHMEIVPDRTRTTFLPIMQANTLPNTVIHSDDYSTYRTAVGQLPSVTRHGIMNHFLHFVDPVTNIHTQHIESYWNRVKIKFKKMRGVDNNQLPSYIDEFMWRERYGTDVDSCLDNLFRDIAHDYPV